MGMYGTLDADLEVQMHHQEGWVDSFPFVPSQGLSVHDGSCGQHRNHREALERRNEVHWPESKGRQSVDIDLEDRTPRRTHFCLSLVVSPTSEHIQSCTHVHGSSASSD